MFDSTSPCVYVNGVRLPLMEDYRFPLYHYFPEGTALFDPSYIPPMRVPLGTAPEHFGVTLRKLLPFGSYEAYQEDPTTGALHPRSMKPVCLYVSNLPSNATPEMLCSFFENFDQVEEADVLRGRDGRCDGRGWVVFKDPAASLRVPRTLEFFTGRVIYAEPGDRDPAPPHRYPPVALGDPHRANGASERPAAAPEAAKPPISPSVPLPRSRKLTGTPSPPPLPLGKGVGVVPVGMGTPEGTRASSPSSLATADTAYVTLHLSEAEAEVAVRENQLWLFPEVFQAIHGLAQSVVVLVLLHSDVFFGCAHLLPSPPSPVGGLRACPVRWIQKCLSLREGVLRKVGGHGILNLTDGSLVKPELAMAICKLTNAQPVDRGSGGQPSPPYSPNSHGGWSEASGRGRRSEVFPVSPQGRGVGRAGGFFRENASSRAVPEPRSSRRGPYPLPIHANVVTALSTHRGRLSIPTPASRRAQVVTMPQNTETTVDFLSKLSGEEPGAALSEQHSSFDKESKFNKPKKEAHTS
ncbi:unnamed protein product [Phytomonas sp. Hart1]|nr:unnamed protein product [Phytomonas sp. Hart1]|eukprot:CCW70854.1 unnamed protein product [Phytomonas sp. isolate Hart1]